MRWENFSAAPLDPGSLDHKPAPQARFAALEVPFTDAKTMNALQKDFLDYAYRTGQVSVHANEALKLYAGRRLRRASSACCAGLPARGAMRKCAS